MFKGDGALGARPLGRFTVRTTVVCKSVSVFENSDWSASSTRGQRAEEVWNIRKSEIGRSSQIQSERRLEKELIRI
jgi:hypothetical protein